MIIRQIVLKAMRPRADVDKFVAYFQSLGTYVGRGILPDGRWFINAYFEDELDALAFMIGSGLYSIESPAP